MVPPSSVVIDVGSDHGLLAVALIKARRARKVINIEKRSKPLASGVLNAERSGCAERIVHVLSDGFAHYRGPRRVDTIVMAGFGGAAMRKILDALPVSWKTLVIQPATDAHQVRSLAKQKKWGFVAETVLSDNKRHYELMVMTRRAPTKAVTDEDVAFGPLNLQTRNDAFNTMWADRLDRMRKAYAQGRRKALVGEIALVERMFAAHAAQGAN